MMGKLRNNEKGFGAIEGLLIVAVVVLLGVVGYMVYKNHITATTNPAPKTTPTQATTSRLALAGDQVKFDVPAAWTINKGSCTTPATATVVCADGVSGATLVPPEKKMTIYGEPFSVSISVYKNTKSETAKQWFENDYTGSLPSNGDKTSLQSINGYDTYSFEQINESYQEQNYVFHS